MNSGIVCLARSLFLLSVLLSPITNSFAAPDNFMPYVFTSISYDSNIFRVANDAEAISILGNTNKDDTARHLGAGFRAELPVSRQYLLVDAVVDKTSYDTFSVLDNTQTEGHATWRWQVGSLWNGNLGYSYSESLSTFNEIQDVLKETETKNSIFLDAGFQVHPDWKLVASLGRSNQSYRERKDLDGELRSKGLELQYKNTINTRMGLRVKVTDMNLDNLENVGGTLVNNDYKQTEMSGVFYWEGTVKSHLEARFGVTDLKYDELTERDFQGSIGRLTYQWLMSVKTKVDTSLWREAGPYYDEITTYVVTNGVSINPVWSVTPFITFNGKFSYQQNDFEAENAVILGSGLPRREDDIRLFSLALSYSPTRNVKVSIAHQTEQRTSNRKDSEFFDRQITAKLQLSF
jgi:exopolysaccharide biosynthesis operon protein EpsL